MAGPETLVARGDSTLLPSSGKFVSPRLIHSLNARNQKPEIPNYRSQRICSTKIIRSSWSSVSEICCRCSEILPLFHLVRCPSLRTNCIIINGATSAKVLYVPTAQNTDPSLPEPPIINHKPAPKVALVPSLTLHVEPHAVDNSCSSSQYNSNSLSSSPRQYPTDISSAILEETTESESESPNEPVTPISGRQSQEFTTVTQDNHNILPASTLPRTTESQAAQKVPLLVNTRATPSPRLADESQTTTPKPVTLRAPTPPQDPYTAPLSRRTTFSSTAGTFKRSLSSVSNKVSLFRRSSTLSSKESLATAGPTSDNNLNGKVNNKSSNTTTANTPPSPGSPVLEMAAVNRGSTMPNQDDFNQRKVRASTGLGIGRRAIQFVNANVAGKDKDKRPKGRKRASSFDGRKTSPPPYVEKNNESNVVPAERLPWPYPPDAGTGAKARRMSLSLPDDFTVDVAELQSEFEYQHKFLGRHGKGLGKGATCKVIVMMRKGCPGELYAVKEFRGKSGRETQEEYEKKVKSEYSIAKSLHHPNIVETIRLCTDRSRWNHVMEYCAEGDLFGLVEKGYLKQESRMADRNCLFKQLVQGVNYLHSNGIAHRDIKLENLLITNDSKLKITDFGVSEVFSGIHPGLREAGGVCGKNMGDVRLCSPGICGSEPYISPEVLAKKGPYDPRALDVWGSAIIMIHLIFGGTIWSKADGKDGNYASLVQGWEEWEQNHVEQGSEAEVTDTDYPHVVPFDRFIKPPALRRILLRMLNPNPDKRITIAEVLSHRWVKSVECCQLESYDDPVLIIDASKRNPTKSGARKIFCHNHLPPSPTHGAPSIGVMPGKPGY